MTEKQYNLRAGYYDEYTGICGGNDENFTTNEVCDKLNSLVDENEQLKQQLFKVQKWLKILHDEHCPSLATIDGVLTEIDKAVNGDER